VEVPQDQEEAQQVQQDQVQVEVLQDQQADQAEQVDFQRDRKELDEPHDEEEACSVLKCSWVREPVAEKEAADASGNLKSDAEVQQDLEPDPDIASLERVLAGSEMRSYKDVSEMVIRILQKGIFGQVSAGSQLEMHRYYEVAVTSDYISEEGVKSIVWAINGLGWLDEFRDKLEVMCSKYGLDFEAILAEQQS
jgi:hypothetical protein